jgi:DNA ligase (NAD+)
MKVPTKTIEFKLYLKNTPIKKLHTLKLKLDELYYNQGTSPVSDDLYDMLKDFLVKNDSSYVPPVGAKLRDTDNRVALPYWLGSADKITPKDTDDIDRWLIANNGSYLAMDKLDGVSCLLIIENEIVKLYTRGDGKIGADISYLASYLNIPKVSDISVRGELIMSKKAFEPYKASGQYKNARNMVAGMIGAKTARAGLKDIDFVTYEIVGDSMEKPLSQLKKLKKLGFTVVKHEPIHVITMENLERVYRRFREESKYDIDGLIVQNNTPYDRNISGNPEYMFAFKMLLDDSIHNAVIKSIEWNVSKWGQLKPVVIIEPIELNDITIQRATAHNAKYVVDNLLGPGAIIKVTRSNEVIPYIVEVVKHAKTAQLPTCPYTWDKNGVNMITAENDSTICVKLISGFFAKLNIKHVSEATVRKMYDNGLNNLIKIVSASKERLLQVPEFQEKSAERIYTNIREGLQNVKLSQLLGASGVFGFGIGRKRMDALLLDIPDLLTIYKKYNKKDLIDLIMGVEGFSYIMAEKVAVNLKYADSLVQKLSEYVTLQSEKRVGNDMIGHKYVMTGFRDKKLEEDIASRGGKVVSTVSKNTTAVIVNMKSDKLTGKLKKADDLGIPIYEKERFISQFIS